LFACRLALALGKTLGEIAEMPESEFITWRAFDLEEPIGSRGDDQRIGSFMKLFFSANAKEGSPIPEFFDRWQAPKPEVAEDQAALDAKIKTFFKGRSATQRKKKTRGKKPDPAQPINTQQTDGGV
jgi:hypothetical protein